MFPSNEDSEFESIKSKSEPWGKENTDYLFDLCRRYLPR